MLLRVTINPAPSAVMNAGTWLTRPSPIVIFVNSSAVGASSQPRSTRPTYMPPAMLTSVMMTPAIASPRVNLLAPSIAP